MAEEKTPTRLELVYDAANGVYKAKLPSWMLGPNPYPALKAFAFTEQDLKNMPGLSYIKEGNSIVGAYVQFTSANKYAQENKAEAEAKKSKKEITPEEAQRLREGEALPEQEYAYRQGRLVTQKNIDEFVQRNPVTGEISFITADAPGAGIYGGTAEGGTVSQEFAVIVPKELGPVAGGTGAMVYNGSVVQESIIKNLLAKGELEDFKQMLAEKGYYTLSGYNNFQIQDSLRQGDTADEFFSISLNRYLSELSQRNYQNVKEGLNPFGAEEYLKTVQPDRAALEAYVPSPREQAEVLKSVYSRYVGRTPSQEELDAFRFALDTEIRSNPRRSTTDFTTGMQITEEGFTADQLEAFATEYTLERPEAQEFGMGQGGLNAISNVFQQIVAQARDEVASVTRPGNR